MAGTTIYRDRCLWDVLGGHGFRVPLHGDGPHHVLSEGNEVLASQNVHLQPWTLPQYYGRMPRGKYILVKIGHCKKATVCDAKATIVDTTERTVIPNEMFQVGVFDRKSSTTKTRHLPPHGTNVRLPSQ